MPDWRVARDQALLVLEAEKPSEARADAAERLCDLSLDVPKADWPELGAVVVRLLGDVQNDVRCAGLALAAHVLSGEEAEELLIRHLLDKDVRVRLEATGRLADLERPSARGGLAQAMRDETFVVRFEAARGMAGLKHASGLEVLLEALDDQELRYRSVAALAELGNVQAVPPLKKIFSKWFLPPFERTQVAGALAKLGDAEGAAHLFKRAGKSWSPDRAMAIEMLGDVKAEGARARLEQIVGDEKDVCRGAAARGLGRLGDPSVAPLLKALIENAAQSDDVRLDALEGLYELSPDDARAISTTLSLTTPDGIEELALLRRELE